MIRIEFHSPAGPLPFGQPAVLLVDADGGVDVLLDPERMADLGLSDHERMEMINRMFRTAQAPPSSQMQVQQGVRDRRRAERRARASLALVV